MEILLFIIWYLIGSIGGLILSRKVYRKTTNGDLVFLFTIGGFGGLLTVIVGFAHCPKSNWWNRQVF